jgi:hypothetical protein
MAWRCDGCTRYWGHCRKVCPLCRLRVAVRIVFRRRIPDAVVRKSILQFAGSYATCVPLLPWSRCVCWEVLATAAAADAVRRPINAVIEFCYAWLAKQAVVALLHRVGCTYSAASWHCGRATGSCTVCFLQPTVAEDRMSAFCGRARQSSYSATFAHGSCDGLPPFSCSTWGIDLI